MCAACDPYDCLDYDEPDYGYELDEYDVAEMYAEADDLEAMARDESDLPDEAWAKLDKLMRADEINPPQPPVTRRPPILSTPVFDLSRIQPQSRTRELV